MYAMTYVELLSGDLEPFDIVAPTGFDNSIDCGRLPRFAGSAESADHSQRIDCYFTRDGEWIN